MSIVAFLILSIGLIYGAYWHGRRIELEHWAKFISEHREKFDKPMTEAVLQLLKR